MPDLYFVLCTLFLVCALRSYGLEGDEDPKTKDQKPSTKLIIVRR